MSRQMASVNHDGTAVSLEVKNCMGRGETLCRVIDLDEAVLLRDQLTSAIRKVRPTPDQPESFVEELVKGQIARSKHFARPTPDQGKEGEG